MSAKKTTFEGHVLALGVVALLATIFCQLVGIWYSYLIPFTLLSYWAATFVVRLRQRITHNIL